MLIEKRRLILASIYLVPFVHSIVLTTLWPSSMASIAQTAIKGGFSIWLIVLGLACIDAKGVRALLSAKSLLLYTIISVASVIWAVDLDRALMALLGFLSLLLLAIASLRVSRLEVCKVLLASCDAIVVLSLFAYAMGLHGATVYMQDVERLSGITFGPHALGRVVVLALLIRFYLYCCGHHFGSISVLIYVFVYGFSLYLTDSRQAYLVILPVLFSVWVLSGNSSARVKFSAFMLVLALSLVPLSGFDGRLAGVAESLNRSATDDITTLTGRTFIWARSIELIGDSPYLGYGLHGGGLVLTQNYATDTSGWTTESAHNLFLQTALDLGLIGLLVVIFVFVGAIVVSFVHVSPLSMALVVFALILGFVERSIAGAPGFMNFLFFYGILLAYLRVGYNESVTNERVGVV